MGSISSSFQFLNFKIDRFEFSLADDLDLLLSRDQIPSDQWNFRIGILRPQFFVENKTYVGGLSLEMKLPREVGAGDKSPEILLSVLAEISGAFRCEEGKLSKEVEEKLVKNQIPAILMPYLRSAITGFLASAGYGSVILPLINMHALIEADKKNFEILIHE